jgi:hypothetical protein
MTARPRALRAAAAAALWRVSIQMGITTDVAPNSGWAKGV